MEKPKIDRKRHLAKAFTWRLIASIITFSLAFLFTQALDKSLLILLFENIIKIGAYYFHERVWYHLNFGIDRRRKYKRIMQERSKTKKS